MITDTIEKILQMWRFRRSKTRGERRERRESLDLDLPWDERGWNQLCL